MRLKKLLKKFKVILNNTNISLIANVEGDFFVKRLDFRYRGTITSKGVGQQ